MSFIEFLRTYWNLERQNNNNINNQINVPQHQIPVPAPRRIARNVNVGNMRDFRLRRDGRRVRMRIAEPPLIVNNPFNIQEIEDINNFVLEQNNDLNFNGGVDFVPNAPVQQLEPQPELEGVDPVFEHDEVEQNFNFAENENIVPQLEVAVENENVHDPVIEIEPHMIQPIREVVDDDAPVDLFEADGEFDDQNELVEFFEAQDRQRVDNPVQVNMNVNPAPLPANVQVPVAPAPAPAAGGGGEVQRQMENEQAIFALNDMFGLHGGPILPVIKNVLMVLTFNFVYISVIAILPYIIGIRMLKLLVLYFDYLKQLVDNSTIQYVTDSFVWKIWLMLVEWTELYKVSDFVVAVKNICNSANQVVRVDDIATIGIGYITVSTLITIVSELINYLAESPLNRLISGQVIEAVNAKALALNKTVKVGTLLFLRILVLPLILGSLLITVFNTLMLKHSIAVMAEFFALNTIGCIGLAWVFGITFMLVVTLSILQLREVLHPDILAKTIRPQETQIELMQSLLYDSKLLHAKRMVSQFLFVHSMHLFLL